MKKLIAITLCGLALVAPLSADISEAISTGDFDSYRNASSYEVKKAAISAYLRFQEEHNASDPAAFAEGLNESRLAVGQLIEELMSFAKFSPDSTSYEHLQACMNELNDLHQAHVHLSKMLSLESPSLAVLNAFSKAAEKRLQKRGISSMVSYLQEHPHHVKGAISLAVAGGVILAYKQGVFEKAIVTLGELKEHLLAMAGASE